jgi:hypothetical protein
MVMRTLKTSAGRWFFVTSAVSVRNLVHHQCAIAARSPLLMGRIAAKSDRGNALV